MKKIFVSVLLIAGLSGCAQLKETGRDIGHATKEATTEIGHATRDATRAIGHASRDAVKSVKEEVKSQ
ncbi:hypothetical protein [Shewanella sp. GXUN23E]|uniref:hypothetical protein n=1 Tax=Shewanella sp. GXUN23E TaxID=3422498 RepID=UPI003D7C685B